MFSFISRKHGRCTAETQMQEAIQATNCFCSLRAHLKTPSAYHASQHRVLTLSSFRGCLQLSGGTVFSPSIYEEHNKPHEHAYGNLSHDQF